MVRPRCVRWISPRSTWPSSHSAIGPWMAIGSEPATPSSRAQRQAVAREPEERVTVKDGKKRLPRGSGRTAPPAGRKTRLNPAEQRTRGMSQQETGHFLLGLRQWAKSAGREKEYLPYPGHSDYRYSRDLVDSYDAWLTRQRVG